MRRRPMKGDRLYLFESTDLANWKYRGVFYERNTAVDGRQRRQHVSQFPAIAQPRGRR